MNDEAFMAYLKTHHPYLYDFEMEVRRVADRSGFGDISYSVTLRNSEVTKSESMGSVVRQYVKPEDNRERGLIR